VTGQTRWIRFATVGLVGIAVQVTVLGLLVDRWRVDYQWATAFGVLAAVAHNFLWHRRWTWRDRPESRSVVTTFITFAAGNGLVSLVGNLVVMRALVGWLHTPAVAANLAAIAICALANYVLADKAVFRDRALLLRPRLFSAWSPGPSGPGNSPPT